MDNESASVLKNDQCATELIRRVCTLAGSMNFLDDVQKEVREAGVQRAVTEHDTPTIFNWLLTTFSYQGVSDQAARTYMLQNGSASWSEIEAALHTKPSC